MTTYVPAVRLAVDPRTAGRRVAAALSPARVAGSASSDDRARAREAREARREARREHERALHAEQVRDNAAARHPLSLR